MGEYSIMTDILFDFDSLGGATANSYTGRTIAVRGSFDLSVVAKSVKIWFNNSGTFTGKAVIWRVSDGVKVAESASQNLSVTGGNFYTVAFATPTLLSPATEYAIGVYQLGVMVGHRSGTFFSAGAAFASSPSYATWTKSEGGLRFTTSGDANPTSNQSGEPGWDFTAEIPNVLPNAPTNVSATDTAHQNPVPVSWTHNDPDGNPQAKYQMRWRLVD